MRLRDGLLLLALAAAGGVAFLLLRPGERPPSDAPGSGDAANDLGIPDASKAATPDGSRGGGDAMPADRLADAMSHGRPTRDFPKGDAAIAGVVVDADGKPVAGATVIATAQPLEDEDPRQSATTMSGDDGRFRFEGVARRKFAVRAEKESQGPSPTVVVEAGKAASDVTLKLTALGWIEGTVVDAQGQPVKTPATIWFLFVGALPSDDESGRHGKAAVVGGTFRSEGLASGRWLAGDFDEDGGNRRVFAEPAEFSVVAGRATRPVVLRVIPGAAISGLVLDETGAAVPRARVDFEIVGDARPGGRPLGMADAGADGSRWTLDGLAAGSWVAYATAPDRAPAAQRLTLAAGQRADVTFTLARPAEIRVRVVDDKGGPHARAIVGVERDGTPLPTVEHGLSLDASKTSFAETDGNGVAVVHVSPGPVRLSAKRFPNAMTVTADVEAKVGERAEATIVIPVGKPGR